MQCTLSGLITKLINKYLTRNPMEAWNSPERYFVKEMKDFFLPCPCKVLRLLAAKYLSFISGVIKTDKLEFLFIKDIGRYTKDLCLETQCYHKRGLKTLTI